MDPIYDNQLIYLEQILWNLIELKEKINALEVLVQYIVAGALIVIAIIGTWKLITSII